MRISKNNFILFYFVYLLVVIFVLRALLSNVDYLVFITVHTIVMLSLLLGVYTGMSRMHTMALELAESEATATPVPAVTYRGPFPSNGSPPDYV